MKLGYGVRKDTDGVWRIFEVNDSWQHAGYIEMWIVHINYWDAFVEKVRWEQGKDNERYKKRYPIAKPD